MTVLTLLLGTPASAAAAPAPRCPPTHDRVVVANKRAVVYEGPVPLGEDGFRPAGKDFYGCTHARGTPYELGAQAGGGSATGTEGIRTFRLGGSFAAFEEFASRNKGEYFQQTDKIVVRDLRDGRILHDVATGTSNAPLEHERRDVGIGSATALVVKSDGAVAWIVELATEAAIARDLAEHSEISEYQVHVVDATGSHILAEGTDIGSQSLTLTGTTLHWTQGGKTMSAPLE